MRLPPACPQRDSPKDTMQALMNLSATHLVLGSGVYLLYVVVRWIFIDPFTSPLRKLRTPPGGEGMVGHQIAVLE